MRRVSELGNVSIVWNRRTGREDFTDDTALTLAHSKLGIHVKMENVSRLAKKVGLKFNVNKSKIMRF